MMTWNSTALRSDLRSSHDLSTWHTSPTPGANTIRRQHNEASEEIPNLKMLPKLKTTDINASLIPCRCHNMNISILSSTLYPGTITWYQYISEMNLLEVAMKKSRRNPKTKQDRQHVLMEPQLHRRHEETHPLGITCLEDSTSGTGGQGVLMTKNNPEMKRLYWNEAVTRMMSRNEETSRTMMWTIW
jgi:hypothetical protein